MPVNRWHIGFAGQLNLAGLLKKGVKAKSAWKDFISAFEVKEVR